jgi:hypothetical protein
MKVCEHFIDKIAINHTSFSLHLRYVVWLHFHWTRLQLHSKENIFWAVCEVSLL